MNKNLLKKRLELYLAAERAILTSQEYQIGSRRLTRADLKEVRATIESLSEQIAMAESPQGRIAAVIF